MVQGSPKSPEDQEPTGLCVTMAEFEAITQAAGRGEVSQEDLKIVQSHVLYCPKCRISWSVEDLLRLVPGPVWEVHLETVRMIHRFKDRN